MSLERNILLKNWEKLENDAIIKEVATKGKYINLCVNFLARRNSLNGFEARVFFTEKVYRYITKLLKNRQIYKAEHILKNIDESPKYVFYEIIMSLPEPDPDLADYIYTYLDKTYSTFQTDLLEMHPYWLLLEFINLTKPNLNYDTNNFINLNLNNLITYQNDNFIKWRQMVVIDYLFQYKNESVDSLIRRESLWKYLVTNRKLFLLNKWAEICADEQYYVQINDRTGFSNFQKFLFKKFSQFVITPEMFREIADDSNYNHVIINNFSKLNFHFTHEIKDNFKLLARLFASRNINRDLIDYEWWLNLLAAKFMDIGMFELLNTNTKHLTKYRCDTEKILTIINLISNKHDMYKLSKLLANYCSGNKTIEMIIIYINTNSIEFTSFKHYDNYVKSIDRNVEEVNNELLLNSLIEKYFAVNLIKLKNSNLTNKDLLELPNFSNTTLMTNNTSNLIKLSYVYYIKQLRASHAIYLYFLDQLRNYSKITKEQINFTIIAVNEMILNNIGNTPLLTHLIAFVEMLGYQTINLRSQIKLIRFTQQNCLSDDLNNTNNNQVEMTANEFLNLLNLSLNNYLCHNQCDYANIYPILYAVINFCNTNKLAYPEDYLFDLIRLHNKWKLFLILCDKLHYPMWQIVRMLDNIQSTLYNNIVKAITFSRSRRDLRSSSNDLLMIIIETMASGASLYERAIKLRSPILIVLSAMEMDAISDERLGDMWRYWLMFSINYEPTNDGDVDDLNLILHCVRSEFLQTLHISVEVFYPKSDFIQLTKYLLNTSKFKFTDTVNNLIQQYIYRRHNNSNNDSTNFLSSITSSNINYILIEHLIYNFDSIYHKKLLLQSYCDTNVSLMIDYCMLLKIIHVIEQCDQTANSYSLLTDLNIKNLLYYDEQEDASGSDNNEYEVLLINLIKLNEYGCALSLYQLLGERNSNKNKNNFIRVISNDYIIIKYWEYKLDSDRNGGLKTSVHQFIDNLLHDVLIYQLNHNLLLEFLVNNLYKFNHNLDEKYLVLKNILEIIKLYNLYPNNVCDRDRIEYEMIQNYIAIKRHDASVSLELYYSKHYEDYIKTKNIISSTYAELKEYAELDVLPICNKILSDPDEIAIVEDLILTYLDEGDIIQALRIQMMYSVKPQDLRFVVFCMSLGETIERMYDLNQSERQLLYESSTRITQVNRNFIKLRSQSSLLSSSPNFTATEFEEFPPREKQDILDVMQGLSNNLQHGKKIAERVIMIYRAAMYLDKEYTDLIKMDNVYSFLESIVNEDFFNKLIIINDIMISMKLSSNEIAEFIGDQMTCSIIRSRFYTMTNLENYGKNILWGFNLDRDFHLFLDLCPSTTKLGNHLLQYCDCLKLYRRMADPANNSTEHLDEQTTKIIEKLQKFMEFQVLSHEKQNIIYVELLIKAHDCYVHECYMEGIANILQRSKTLNIILTNSKSWNLIVRLLIGIGQYREMYYCFETLIKNDHFESLLVRQHDNNYSLSTLKTAIISYLRENYNENTAIYLEYYKLAAVHFCMYKELGQMYESESNILLGKLLSDCEVIRDYEWNREILKLPYIKYSESITQKLNLIMEKNIHAAENYLRDNKLNLAQRSALNGELIALQLSLFKLKLDNCENSNDLMVISVLNIRNYGIFRYFINNILNFHQTLILNRTYSTFEINWAEVIYNQYILNNNRDYLSDFLVKIDLSESLLENIVKLYQMEMKISQQMEISMRMLIEKIDTVALKYKLASLLGFKTIVSELLNNQSVYYLKDTDYGRNNLV